MTRDDFAEHFGTDQYNYPCRAWGEMDYKVIEFDWAGVLGVVRYPVDRNQIPWPVR